MAKDEYFSFGDEELNGALDASFLREESGAVGALALADPPEEPLAAEEGYLAAEKRAARPRGDSAKGSSEKRRPSARRTHLAIAVALSLVGFLCVRVVVAGLGGDVRSSSASQPTADGEVRGGTEAPGGPRVPAVRLRLSRERAVERQQIRGRRANTRRRARRHREKRKAERRHRAELLREEKSAREAPAPEYVPPPAPEAAAPSVPEPETSEANATPDGGGLHDGSSSAEFGL